MNSVFKKCCIFCCDYPIENKENNYDLDFDYPIQMEMTIINEEIEREIEEPIQMDMNILKETVHSDDLSIEGNPIVKILEPIKIIM